MLCFEHLSTSRRDVIQVQAGIKEAAPYLASIYETRFIESFKSYVASPFLDTSPGLVGISHAVVDNPNLVLKRAIEGKTVKNTVVLAVSSATSPAFWRGSR